ncbi:hypothetical protein CHUAL_002933 [Chamberlinius hualienensis]
MELAKWRWRRRRPFGWLLTMLLVTSLSSVLEAICPSKCVCNDETLVVMCEHANLDVVPITLNPGIKQLRLKNNNIKAVIAAFSFYKDLEYLDMAHNKLVSIGTDSFEAQVKLKVLKLTHNQISLLEARTFYGLENLRVLNLAENMLESIPDRMFVHLKSLEELDLGLNRISRIAANAFHGLKSLRTLRLRDNRLTHVPSAVCWQPINSTLYHLNLGSNTFLNIPADVFQPLYNLQELILDSCSTKDLHVHTFNGLDELRILRLRDNVFTSVPTHAWEHLQRLEELYIGQNHFEEVGPNAFAGLARLRSLDISGSKRLFCIRRSAFTANTDLRKVVLSHNIGLSHIESGAFDGLPLFRHLSLRGNVFQTLNDDLLAWDELDVLDLRDNPLECNCSLLWLRNFLVKRNVSVEESSSNGVGVLASTTIKCMNPSSLRSRLLVELGPVDLDCYYPNPKQQALIAIIGASVLLLLLTLILLVYKYRKRVTSVLKDKWTDGALRRKDLHYEKTADEEENNILQAAQQSLKLTPVTEL